MLSFALAAAAALIGLRRIGLRRDAEVGYMVTLGASYLLTPLQWGYYLAMLVLPASFVAARGRPWALALPLLSWLPEMLLPFVLILATLPFLARDAEPQAAASSQALGPAGIWPALVRPSVPARRLDARPDAAGLPTSCA